MDDAQQIGDLIEAFSRKCTESGRVDGAFSGELELVFTDLERCAVILMEMRARCSYARQGPFRMPRDP